MKQAVANWLQQFSFWGGARQVTPVFQPARGKSRWPGTLLAG